MATRCSRAATSSALAPTGRRSSSKSSKPIPIFRRGRRRKIGIGFDDFELERRPVGAKADDVAALEQRVAIDALAVHEGAVATAQILEDEPLGLAHDRGVARRDVEVPFGIEADVRERVAAEPDVTLAEGFDLPRAGPGEKLELGFHCR